jgi:hypothetical protein
MTMEKVKIILTMEREVIKENPITDPLSPP